MCIPPGAAEGLVGRCGVEGSTLCRLAQGDRLVWRALLGPSLPCGEMGERVQFPSSPWGSILQYSGYSQTVIPASLAFCVDMLNSWCKASGSRASCVPSPVIVVFIVMCQCNCVQPKRKGRSLQAEAYSGTCVLPNLMQAWKICLSLARGLWSHIPL